MTTTPQHALLTPPAALHSASQDVVVLLNDNNEATGTYPRADVHTTETPRHLAFSCYLLDDNGDLLVTRRALAKKTWPGVWTNSFCGHPRPGESFEDAITRYAEHELGITDIHSISVALPDFAYRAVDASGIVENEFCPVFFARTSQQPQPNPDEVAEHAWTPLAVFVNTASVAPYLISPWAVEQTAALHNTGGPNVR